MARHSVNGRPAASAAEFRSLAAGQRRIAGVALARDGVQVLVVGGAGGGVRVAVFQGDGAQLDLVMDAHGVVGPLEREPPVRHLRRQKDVVVRVVLDSFFSG